MEQRIILASASPRRRRLLQQIGIGSHVHPVDIDETPQLNETPRAYVERVAAEKSQVCYQQLQPEMPVLGADTAVVIDGRILRKPVDEADACSMLQLLSGRTHVVYTAVSLRGLQHDQVISATEVSFRALEKAEMTAYWNSGEPIDKAGAYAIQGLAGVFVESIRGSFSGVVGLPLFETAQLLEKQGIRIIS